MHDGVALPKSRGEDMNDAKPKRIQNECAAKSIRPCSQHNAEQHPGRAQEELIERSLRRFVKMIRHSVEPNLESCRRAVVARYNWTTFIASSPNWEITRTAIF
jgi:hypothetical protein